MENELPGGGLRTFDGAVAVVTGGASGIGRALAEALARRGAAVVLADRQIDLAREVAGGIRQRGGEAGAAEVDVTEAAAVEALIGDTFAARGRLDYLFNNAGIGIGGGAELYRLEHWTRVLDVNVRGVVHGVQAAYPRMLRQGFGHIVSTASIAGLLPAPGTVSYGASKHAVVGMTRSLRVEAKSLGVRVSAICPGVVRTSILDGGRYGEILQPFPREFQDRLWRRLRPMDPDRFAVQALAGVAADREIIVVPARWKLLWWLDRLSPALGSCLARWFYEAQKRDLESLLADSGSGSASLEE
jgi:NAD(P)-dependent dehydrogenase (short-subunit alcohol dehydrogenase family)